MLFPLRIPPDRGTRRRGLCTARYRGLLKRGDWRCGSLSSTLCNSFHDFCSRCRTKDGCPRWCRTLDDPAVTALPNILPQLLTKDASAAVPKVQAAATVMHKAAASAPAEPSELLTDAAGSLDAAASEKSATSLQAVSKAFTSLSKGVQSACGFH